ncbi:MAG: LacI family DNA-binding transcriptional regulator, partial [Pseudomonadota bacterium]
MVSGHDLPPTEHDIPETDSSARQELTAKPRKPPTIRDVAAEAGVSRATVSRVLNGGKWVSPSAAKAVEEAMTRMRYVASHSARSLNTRRSGAVALVVTQRRDHLFEDPSLSVLTRELMTRLAEYQRTLFVTVAADEASRKSVIQQMRSGLLDGLILASTQGDDPLPEALAAADLPAVLCGEPPEGASGLPH